MLGVNIWLYKLFPHVLAGRLFDPVASFLQAKQVINIGFHLPLNIADIKPVEGFRIEKVQEGAVELVHSKYAEKIFVPSLLLIAALSYMSAGHAVAQTAPKDNGQLWLHTVPTFDMADNPITLRRHAESEKPFTVAGECGAMMGQQNGKFESWIFPVKLFSQMTIEAHVDGYDVPIDVNRDAAEIEVSPDHTTITYSHIAFTLKEILFATQCSQQDGTGIVALFQIDSIRPMTLTFSFTPEMKTMWPAPISSDVNAEWVKLNQPANSGI